MNNKKIISLDEIYPIIKEKLENNGTVGIPITGTSMLPLLVQGRDTVIIKKAEKYNVNDIIFYRRDNGAFVLHRIIDIDSNGYVLCGDNQWLKEYGITDKNIIGVVIEITRNGKQINIATHNAYRQYIKWWLRLFPVRKPIIKILSMFRAIKRKITK